MTGACWSLVAGSVLVLGGGVLGDGLAGEWIPDASVLRFFADGTGAEVLVALAEPRSLAPGAIDFGCGPGPALAAMLREAGHEVALYDVFFAPDQAVLHRQYDFVTCTETAEHFHDPAAEFRLFDTLLKPGGWLGVMTGMLPEGIDFGAWHYRRDPTHVVFYQRATLRYLAHQYGWRCEFPGQDVALMHKPDGQTAEAGAGAG